jgi:hypothetical protein
MFYLYYIKCWNLELQHLSYSPCCFLHSPFNFQRKWSKWRVLTPSPPPRLLPDRILCQLFDWHQFSFTKVKLACEIVPDSRRNPAQQILLCRCTLYSMSLQHTIRAVTSLWLQLILPRPQSKLHQTRPVPLANSSTETISMCNSNLRQKRLVPTKGVG